MTKQEAFGKFKPLPQDRSQKILLITHNDLDGSGTAILFGLVYPNLDVIHVSNSEMSKTIRNAVYDPENQKYSRIIATDISVDTIDAAVIDSPGNERKNNFMLIDHHPTACHLNKYSWAVVIPEIINDSFRTKVFPQNTKTKQSQFTNYSSATSLVYDLLEMQELIPTPENIRLVQDLECMFNAQYLQNFVHTVATYDTGGHKHIPYMKQDCMDMALLHDIYGCERFEKMIMEQTTTVTNPRLFNQEAVMLLELEHDRIKHFLRDKEKRIITENMRINKPTYSVAVCFADKYMDDLFQLMQTKYPDTDLYMINYGTGISVRTENPDINAGKLMACYGGGGHAQAAGIQIPVKEQLKTIKQRFRDKNLISH